MTVTVDFFAKMEELVAQRKYIKIDESGETIAECANKAMVESLGAYRERRN